MKRYFFLLAIFVSACSSNSTAPPVPAPPHPFPNAFKQVTVSYRNLPEHWENSSSSYMFGQNGTNTFDSGTGSLSGSWNFYFTDTAFTLSGDTLKTHGLTLVADQSTGVLKYLNVAYSHDTNAFEEAPWSASTSYGLTCHNITYTKDSSDQIVVNLSGQPLQTGLTGLWYSYEESLTYSGHGNSSNNSDNYIGAVVDSSTLTIHFIP